MISLPILLLILDAHNCYPENGRFKDRIERALRTGLHPIAIEQDLSWHNGKSVLSHEKTAVGGEPGMREYFFERIRPAVERELKSGDRSRWPLIILNLDFKTDEREHHEAVWKLLGEYEPWLSTAKRTAGAGKAARIDWKPILVLTGVSDEQERTFHDAVPVGGALRVFGAARVGADRMPRERAGNYRRWWNNPWSVVEEGGQQKAGDWTAADRRRLAMLVKRAHAGGLWIRFYTLNGHQPEDGEASGWTRSYNFGSIDAARLRWRAAIEAGVDFIATDQYEQFADVARPSAANRRLRRLR
jgi:hypothetical protein